MALKKYSFILSLFFVAFLAFSLNAETDVDPPVTIYILSKQVRLLKSGAIKQISITVKNNITIRDEINNRGLEGKNIAFLFQEGMINGYLDSKALSGPGRLDISSGPENGQVAVIIDGSTRSYPLPMTIQYGKDYLTFHVRERLNQYAVDSSLAEYSSDFWKEKEGILALAHVIRARYFFGRKSHRHGKADFCDLTHCQVYRGRINSVIRFDDDWVIDHTRLQHNLFFHSRCGGRTRDPGIFSGKKTSGEQQDLEVRDWLYREGITLCAGKDSHWERTMGHEELRHILLPGTYPDGNDFLKLQYEGDIMKVSTGSTPGDLSFPVETFRLKINRVKGWNFIRSNNFTVSEKILDNNKHYQFKGEGLGHGVGLCQHGAMALSRLGYNRYEILEHYYPDVQLKPYDNKSSQSPYCSYYMFDVGTGKMFSSSQGQGFLSRKVPPGSIFKIVVSLYVAAERPDIFNDYSFFCTGKAVNDPNMPDRCWKPKGHGTMKMQDAIPNSCNLYFASLYKIISGKKFRAFYQNFCRAEGIPSSLPENSSERQWAELLAGLDFRVSFTPRDLIAMARYVYCGNAEDGGSAYSVINVPDQEKVKIFQGLRETFTRGTALEQKKRYGSSYNYLPLEKADKRDSCGRLTDLWGKTATVIDGTNKPVSYGIFMGGNGRHGIIVVLRKATGNMAARWARKILSQSIAED